MIKVIFWDFDGVLMNSNRVRDLGFKKVFENYPKGQVDKLMDFHHVNGGLSRYVKIRYFFEEVRGEQISDEQVQDWANQFSVIMMDSLVDKNLLISATTNFVKENYQGLKMHIVSGSDGVELKKICQGVEIAKYFKSVEGSPTPKIELVSNILQKYGYLLEECLLIGDSINDFEAAENNGIYFKSFNATSSVDQKTNIDYDI
jgi:phosphoglycolate phosphatase-like HAD superfamily hydrolase